MMNLNDTISAFRCCTLVPPRCSKCPLTEMCKWSLSKDRCKTEVKLSVNHWLKAQEQVVVAGAELTDAELIEEIRKAPIVLKPNVDAVPVVRCRDCKWWNGSTLGVAHRCAALHIATTGEFYCAAAERKCNAYADQSGAEYADNPTV